MVSAGLGATVNEPMPVAERRARVVGEVDRRHHDDPAGLDPAGRGVHAAHAPGRRVQVHVELHGHRHAGRHVLDGQQARERVGPGRQHRRPEHVGARHQHLGDDRRRAAERVAVDAHDQPELMEEVPGGVVDRATEVGDGVEAGAGVGLGVGLGQRGDEFHAQLMSTRRRDRRVEAMRHWPSTFS